MPAREHLVLIPGLGDDPHLWVHQTRHLSDVAIPEVADIAAGDSVAALARSILAKTPPVFALCGFSLGGYVAFEIMRQAPARISRLALVATNAAADTEERRAERLVIMAEAERPAGFRQIIRAQLPEVVAPQHRLNGTLTRQIVDM